MAPRLSSLIANAALFGALPLGLLGAYLGYRSGLYPYRALPFVAVGIVLVVIAVLFAVLPRLRRRELAE